MLYKYVIRGCVCWLSEETIETLEEERKALEDEQNAWKTMKYALRMAQETNDPQWWGIYSDMHKDFYGVRPH